MLPFKFVDVKEDGIRDSKPYPIELYSLTDSEGRKWSFGMYTNKQQTIESGIFPMEYQQIRGTTQARPFFAAIEDAAKQTINSYKIKKNINPETAKTLEDLINDL
jgi:hypothetical protein